MHTKVVHRTAKFLAERFHLASLRFNFRGVGASEGIYDEGRGETDDLVSAVRFTRERYPAGPLALAGFSFGSLCAARAALVVEPTVLLPHRRPFGPLGRGGGEGPRRPQRRLGPGRRGSVRARADRTRPPPATAFGRPSCPGADHFFTGRLDAFEKTAVSLLVEAGLARPRTHTSTARRKRMLSDTEKADLLRRARTQPPGLSASPRASVTCRLPKGASSRPGRVRHLEEGQPAAWLHREPRTLASAGRGRREERRGGSPERSALRAGPAPRSAEALPRDLGPDAARGGVRSPRGDRDRCPWRRGAEGSTLRPAPAAGRTGMGLGRPDPPCAGLPQGRTCRKRPPGNRATRPRRSTVSRPRFSERARRGGFRSPPRR